jgi:hypothetical protein
MLPTLKLILLLILSESAFAYVDPGVGSVAVQLVVGGIAVVCLYFKRIWGWITFRSRLRKKKKDE